MIVQKQIGDKTKGETNKPNVKLNVIADLKRLKEKTMHRKYFSYRKYIQHKIDLK